MARRAVILEQHRLKKAVEEAEREGKTLDRGTQELLRQQTAAAPKMRAQKVQRPRPKTIHVDAASVDSSKGSSSNLTGNVTALKVRQYLNFSIFFFADFLTFYLWFLWLYDLKHYLKIYFDA